MENMAAAHWSFAQKLAFRFFLILFLLYIFFNPNGVMPYTDPIFNYYIPPFHSLIAWIGRHMMHLEQPITIFTNGSGDTTYDFIVVLSITVFSLVAALVWSLIDQRATSYNRLFYWLCTLVRYYVAITMLSYGFAKIFKSQFPFFTPDRLLEQYGNSSPMGLAWNFFGFSTGYNYVMGSAEVASALFLFFRRTTTLGALLTLVVAGNIMAINYCFDVPVKLLSTALVVMALFLLSKDIRRLVNFFFLNKAVHAASAMEPVFKKKWQNVATACLKYGLILYVLIFDVDQAIEATRKYGDTAPPPPLYGLYEVKTFIQNNDTLPPLTTDTFRWKNLMISYPGYAFIRNMGDSIKGYAFNPDTVNRRIDMYRYSDTTRKGKFAYTIPRANELILAGRFGPDSLIIQMKKYELKNFRLINRGFHWINEYPNNE